LRSVNELSISPFPLTVNDKKGDLATMAAQPKLVHRRHDGETIAPAAEQAFIAIRTQLGLSRFILRLAEGERGLPESQPPTGLRRVRREQWAFHRRR
jgi:hypothetical protein